jgi:hypothetical protein
LTTTENRPKIIGAKIELNMHVQELFQNETLRPVIKMKHLLLIEVLKNALKNTNGKFFELPKESKIQYLNNFFLKDLLFRNQLLGIIIGQFSMEEYNVYSNNSSALNKRIINIVKERFLNSIDEIN